MPRPIFVKALSLYRLWVRYDNGVEGEVDLSHLAGKGVFIYWEQGDNFQQVYLGPGGAITWSDEIELCPDSIYLRLTGLSPEELFPALKIEAMNA